MAHVKRDQLIGLLHQVHNEQENLLAELPAAERHAPSNWGKWAPKDMLAHIVFWEKRFLEDCAQLDAEPRSSADFNELNRENFERNAPRSYKEIYAEAERVFTELVAQVQQRDDEELMQSDRYRRFNGNPFSTRLINNSVTHMITHLVQFCDERGDVERARRINEDGVQAALAFDESPAFRGVTLYNLACFYSLHGERDRAVELLRASLPLRADLVEFSKQDTDLIPLHDMPEYQALYN
ncbi:MAG TPA: DinB family protein [Anaerolineae bacterium]|nr:DinB family protein [Anaerolineae bacterium]